MILFFETYKFTSIKCVTYASKNLLTIVYILIKQCYTLAYSKVTEVLLCNFFAIFVGNFSYGTLL